MEKNTWSWKIKYLVLFLWIFLFSCKAHEAVNNEVQEKEKAAVVIAAGLWEWIQVNTSQYR